MSAARKYAPAGGINLAQIRKIHTLKNALKMSESDYRSLVMSVNEDGFAASAKDLSYREAGLLIEIMEKGAMAKGVWERRTSGKRSRYEDLGQRKGMASPAQLRKIEAMWMLEISYAPTEEAKRKALDKFLFNFCGISSLRFLEQRDVRRVIRTFEAMKEKSRG